MLTLLEVSISVGPERVTGPEGLGGGTIRDFTLGGIISAFLPIILTVAGILTLVWLIIGGFRLLFSGGDPKAVAGARDNITFALIGLTIVFAAWWLTLIVQRALGICIIGC